MDTEEKYVTSYELSQRNQQESRAILEEITKMWLFLKGERACVTFERQKNLRVYKFTGVYIHSLDAISICVEYLCAMGGITRTKSGVLLLPVQTWTGLGETVLQYLQVAPPAMKSSTDFHSAHFRFSLPSPKTTQNRSMLCSKSCRFSKSILNIYNLENFLGLLVQKNLLNKTNK